MNVQPSAPAQEQQQQHQQHLNPARWRCSSFATIVLMILSAGLILVGLAGNNVLTRTNDRAYGETIRDDEVFVSYYKASVKRYGSTKKEDISIDGATCGNAARVRTAGAFHYLALFSCVACIALLSFETSQNRGVWHFPVFTIVFPFAALIVMYVLLGDASEASESYYNRQQCAKYTQVNHNDAVTITWTMVAPGFAFPLIFSAFIVHVVGRYCGCCCCPNGCCGNCGVEVPQQQQLPNTTTAAGMVQMGVPMQPNNGMQLVQPVDQFGRPMGPPIYVPINAAPYPPPLPPPLFAVGAEQSAPPSFPPPTDYNQPPSYQQREEERVPPSASEAAREPKSV